MESNHLVVTIIMPALNEEENILEALDNTLSAFKEFGIKGEIIVINDGSIDSTPLLIEHRMKEYPSIIRMISHDTPKGIGASFWDGVDLANGEAVVMLPGDNENDPWEIMRYINLLKDVDMVVPFVFNKETRSLLRNILSFIYRFIVNNTFLISLNYTNGNVIYRKSLLTELNYRSSGFFFQTDILIRLVKGGYLFAEVPYRLSIRKEGRSKALTLRSFYEVTKGYFRLMRDIYFKKDKRICVFSPDSISAKRYGELNKK